VASLAEKAPRAAPKALAPRVVPLELKALIAPYRENRRLTLRIENLPQLARLSAGQNNGDHTWSLALDELEDLSYFPPEGFEKEHTLTIRVISKDETGASTIAMIDFRIPSADNLETPALQVPGKRPLAEMAQDKVLREETAKNAEAFKAMVN